MPEVLRRYVSSEEDSARWHGLPFRDGDVVISTRSKSGTTWMQMICALLVFRTTELPRPLAELSPWLDWLVTPRDEVYATLEAQTHRRFIKTHTPLDGVPSRRGVTYVVVARHPLDMAVSLYHQSVNLDRRRIAELTGLPQREGSTRPPLHEWLVEWVEDDPDPQEELDSLPGVMHHLTDAWGRREDGNVVLVHYDDLRADLEREMRTLADRLGVDVPGALFPNLVAAASFEQMQSRAELLVPDRRGVLKSPASFFRRGASGEGRSLLSRREQERYDERAAELAPSELLSWLHR